jgi:hypothetical protein
MKIENKKGVELSFQAIVVMIISLIVLIVLIMFFVKHYGGNADTVVTVGKDAINSATNYN